jgi:lipopolysaccharide biosynthesis regulator YciM
MRKAHESKKVLFENRDYEWDGESWCDAKSKVIPPLNLQHKLNALLVPELSKEDEHIKDVHMLFERAREAKETLQYNRAETLLNKILIISPGNQSAISMLCSTLRENQEPARALEMTESYKNSGNKYLATSRAAAFCDLEQWEKADKEVRKAIALSGGISDQLSLVMNRIKSARPNLYNTK